MGSVRKICRPGLALAMLGVLWIAGPAAAQDDWRVDASIYAWLPIIEAEAEDGTTSEIARDDILKDFDVAALWAVQVWKGRWSLTSDFGYPDISSKTDVALLLNLPDLSTPREAGTTAWIITPNVGYTVLENDKQKIDLHAGARYCRIEFDVTIDIDPIGPVETPTSQKESPSVS